MTTQTNSQKDQKKKKNIPGVHCDVSNCVYNGSECKCCADRINVGPMHADNSSDTVCSTFKPE
jgi:hypothetical protein